MTFKIADEKLAVFFCVERRKSDRETGGGIPALVEAAGRMVIRRRGKSRFAEAFWKKEAF